MFIKLTATTNEIVIVNCNDVQYFCGNETGHSKIWFKTAETEYLIVVETINEIMSKISELQGVVIK